MGSEDNPAYRGLRRLLCLLKLDGDRFGRPLAMDAVEAAPMGLDVAKIKQITEGFALQELPLARFSQSEIQVSSELGWETLEDVYRQRAFLACEPSRGFRGHIASTTTSPLPARPRALRDAGPGRRPSCRGASRGDGR